VVEIAQAQNGDLRVWWIPQVPDSEHFSVPVKDVEQAKLVLDTLAKYDLYQLARNIKPDYSNAGGLNTFEDGEWSTWYSELGEDIDDIMKKEGEK